MLGIAQVLKHTACSRSCDNQRLGTLPPSVPSTRVSSESVIAPTCDLPSFPSRTTRVVPVICTPSPPAAFQIEISCVSVCPSFLDLTESSSPWTLSSSIHLCSVTQLQSHGPLSQWLPYKEPYLPGGSVGCHELVLRQEVLRSTQCDIITQCCSVAVTSCCSLSASLFAYSPSLSAFSEPAPRQPPLARKEQMAMLPGLVSTRLGCVTCFA